MTLRLISSRWFYMRSQISSTQTASGPQICLTGSVRHLKNPDVQSPTRTVHYNNECPFPQTLLPAMVSHNDTEHQQSQAFCHTQSISPPYCLLGPDRDLSLWLFTL